MLPPPPTSTLFPYTTLFRSVEVQGLLHHRLARLAQGDLALDLRVDALHEEAEGVHVLELGLRPQLRRRSEEHTSELQSHVNLVCRLLLEKKKKNTRLL